MSKIKTTEEIIETFSGKKKMLRPANGEKIKVSRDSMHGDWKSQIKRPLIPANTEVEVVGFMQNLEGNHMTVKYQQWTYDIPVHHFYGDGFSRWY